MEITSNSTQNRQKTLNVKRDNELVFQKNSLKMQTCINPILNKIMTTPE